MSYKFCICKKADNGGCDGGNVTPVDPKPPSCADCLVGKTVRFDCSNSPQSGGTLEVDLTLFAAIDACKDDAGEPCAVEWSIGISTEGISGATITQAGVLTLTAAQELGEHEVQYKINCPCSNLSTTGCVIICLKDPCEGVTCPDGEKCDGYNGCVAKETDLTLESSTDVSSGTSGNGGLTLE